MFFKMLIRSSSFQKQLWGQKIFIEVRSKNEHFYLFNTTYTVYPTKITNKYFLIFFPKTYYLIKNTIFY